ncbi:MAG TPA: L,D-transpeptidase [Anaerolineales bacterium]|nr:L,D-transpeptidase [Anaerolineales bacterium]
MSKYFSRRDFLKLGGLSLGGLALPRLTGAQSAPDLIDFDDSDIVRVATSSVSVYSTPSLDLKKSTITGTWYKDDLVHVYEQVTADEPKTNPIWYRVWGGYMWRARLQPVKTLLNLPLTSIPDGMRLLAEVTVPFTQPWRFSKTYGWDSLQFRLYYESVYWIEVIVEGPDGQPWYRIFDDLTGSYYYANAAHLRPILPAGLGYISPELPAENKRIEVNLTTQTLTAYENEVVLLQTNISSGVPSANHTTTPTSPPEGFHIQDKYPSKHMGDGNLASGPDDYELPGVPWTSFFTDYGHAFHGTYWHDNFGTPMSHGCVNMRTAEAKWLFFWARPQRKDWSSYIPQSDKIDDIGYGTLVNIHY